MSKNTSSKIGKHTEKKQKQPTARELGQWFLCLRWTACSYTISVH